MRRPRVAKNAHDAHSVNHEHATVTVSGMNASLCRESINRRLLFAAGFRYGLHSALGALVERPVVYRGAELAAQLGCDLGESLRTRRAVPRFGRPVAHVPEAGVKIVQHPRYRTYYRDDGANAAFGMHLGVDFIMHDGKLYPVDLNLNAAIRRQRRALYTGAVDPMLLTLRDLAAKRGYRKVVCFAESWSADYVQEFMRLSKDGPPAFVPASPGRRCLPGVTRLVALPQEPEADTLSVVFHYQHCALDYFMTNQHCTSRWLNRGIDAGGSRTDALGSVASFGSVREIDLDDSDELPNVVIKLGGGWSGNLVRIARFDAELRDSYAAFTARELRSIFRLSLFERLRGWCGGHHELVFQKFIPPDTDQAGKARIIRAHMLVCPDVSAMLSCHRVVSDAPLPRRIPLGILEGDAPFIVNYSKGAHYRAVEAGEEALVSRACAQLGELIQGVVGERFVIGGTQGNPGIHTRTRGERNEPDAAGQS